MSSPRRRPCWTTTEGRGAVRTPRPTRLGRFMAPMSVQLLPVEATHEPPFHPANLCPRWDKDLQFQIHGPDVRWAKSAKLATNLVAVGILARRRAGASSPAERAWQNLGCFTHCGVFPGGKDARPLRQARMPAATVQGFNVRGLLRGISPHGEDTGKSGREFPSCFAQGPPHPDPLLPRWEERESTRSMVVNQSCSNRARTVG